jgi:hypothetical protein
MSLVNDTMLEAHAIKQLQGSWTQSISLARKDLCSLLVDDPGSYTADSHPVGGHQAGRPRADDETDVGRLD